MIYRVTALFSCLALASVAAHAQIPTCRRETDPTAPSRGTSLAATAPPPERRTTIWTTATSSKAASRGNRGPTCRWRYGSTATTATTTRPTGSLNLGQAASAHAHR